MIILTGIGYQSEGTRPKNVAQYKKNDKDGILLQYFESIDEITYLVPSMKMVGLGGFELPTSPLSGVRSNQLSYRPVVNIFND